MAINLGGGQFTKTGSDSSQLLQTGALQRQQAEQNTRAQAGAMLQELKAEAANRGWSMRRMAEAYPDQFKAASAAMLGGGKRGLAGADQMWAETVGGPETEEQYMKFAKDRDFAAANPEGTAYVEWEEQVLNPGTIGTPQTGEAESVLITADRNGNEIPEGVANALQTDPEAYFKNALSLENPQDRRYAAMLTSDEYLNDLKSWVSSSDTDLGKALNERINSSEEGSEEYWNAVSDAMKISMDQPDAVSSSTEAEVPKDFKTAALNMDRTQLSRRENEALNNLVNNWDTASEQMKDLGLSAMQLKAEGKSVDEIEALWEPRWKSENGVPYPGGWVQNLPALQVGAGTEGATPPQIQKAAFNTVEQETAPQEQQAPQTQTQIGGMVGYQAERDRAIEQGASPANQRYQEILAGRDAEATIRQKDALTELYGAQSASQYGNLELAYQAAASGGNLQSMEGRFDEAYIKSGIEAQKQYFDALAEAEADAPPARAYTEEGFTTWFDELSNPAKRRYVEATQTFANLVGSNPALASQWEVVEVPYKGGFLGWGNKNATVVRPTFATQGTAPTSMAQLMGIMASMGIGTGP